MCSLFPCFAVTTNLESLLRRLERYILFDIAQQGRPGFHFNIVAVLDETDRVQI